MSLTIDKMIIIMIYPFYVTLWNTIDMQLDSSYAYIDATSG